MSKLKLVFFDCDGVLLFGHPLTRLEKELNIYSALMDQWDGYYSNKISFDEWIKNIEHHYSKAKLTKEKYLQVVDINNYQINREAEELVEYMKNRSVDMAIISSGSPEYVSQVADHFGIVEYRVNTILNFDNKGFFSHFDTFGTDPDVKVMQIKKICQEKNVDAAETLFIGDSDNDLKAFAYTKHGILYKTINPLFEKWYWKRVEDLRDIIKIIEGGNFS
jgi:HAD superfamily phosphoserine phosphatase-like hydrolase